MANSLLLIDRFDYGLQTKFTTQGVFCEFVAVVSVSVFVAASAATDVTPIAHELGHITLNTHNEAKAERKAKQLMSAPVLASVER